MDEQNMPVGNPTTAAPVAPAAATQPVAKTEEVAKPVASAPTPTNVQQSATPKDANPTPTQPAPKMLSQEEVNKIVQTRIAEVRNNLYTKYGVKTDAEFEAFISKAKQYGEMETKYNEMNSKWQGYEQRRMMFMNNVSSQKFEDVLAYMKGKDIPLTEDNLKKEIASHPEWVRQSTAPVVQPVQVGKTGATEKPQISDKDRIRQLFPSLSK
jgi:hypothetical protein